MNIRVGQNSGALLPFWDKEAHNAANKADNRLMANNMLMQQSGRVRKDVAQFADSFYERQARKEEEKKSRMREMSDPYPGRIAEESANYAQSLSTTRTSKKKTNTQVKKLQYNYKSISSQLMRAKTSVSAKQVVLKAKRMVAQLKRKKDSQEYDEDELELALTHAQAMERVARKRARHLQEEELVKVTGGVCEGELEEKLEEKADPLEEEQDKQKQEEVPEDEEQLNPDSMEQMMREYERLMEEYQRMQEESSDDLMEDYEDMMEDAMEKMMEDSGLSELKDETVSGLEREMDPADYKMMKLKHRMEELKAIAKADAAYLKGMFDKYQEERSKAASAISSPGVGGSAEFGSSGMQGMSAPVADSGAAAVVAFVGASVDVSV